MRKLIINKSLNSPEVHFDPDNKRFEITGESRPSNVYAFYDELIRWVDEYSVYLSDLNEREEKVEFNLDLNYFNSSSARYILDFCKKIATLHSKCGNVKVRWHYEADDVDILEAGREMSRMAKIPFEYVEKGFDDKPE